MNDYQILHISNLYQKAMNGKVFQLDHNEKGIEPYIVNHKKIYIIAMVNDSQINKFLMHDTWS